VRRKSGDEVASAVWSVQDPATQSWTDRGSTGTRVAAGHLIELALSRDVLGVIPGTQVEVFITVSRRAAA